MTMTEDEFNILMIDRDEREQQLRKDLKRIQQESDESDERWHAEVLELESAKEKLEERVRDLQNSTADGKVIAELRTRVEDADMLCDELEKEKKVLEQQVSELQLRAPTNDTNNKDIQAELVEKNKKLEAQLSPLHDEVSLLRSKLKLASSKSNDQDTIQELRTEIASLREEAAAEKNLFDSALLTSDHSALQSQLDSLTAENASIKQQHILQIQSIQAEGKEAITSLQDEINKLNNRVAELTQAAASQSNSNAEADALQERVTSLEKKLSTSEKAVSKLTNDKAALKQTIKELKEKPPQIENYEDIEKLTEEVSSLKKELQDSNDEACKLQKQKAAGNKREEKLTTKVRTQANELSTLRSKVRKTEGDSKKMDKKIASLEADIEDQKATIESLIQRKEGLKKENSRMSDEVADWKSKCKKMLRKMETDKDKKRKAFNLLQRVKGQENLRPPSEEMQRYSLATVRCRALSTVPQRDGEYESESSPEKPVARAKSSAPSRKPVREREKSKRRPFVVSPDRLKRQKSCESSTPTRGRFSLSI